jgi:HEAT repeat protein
MNKSQNGKGNGSRVTTDCSPELIRSLIADLNNKNKDVRLKAQKSLISIGEPATRCLVETLASPNGQMRWEAMKILDNMNVDWRRHADAATVRALIVDLGSKDGLVRIRARRALVTIGKKSVAPLEEALTSKREWTRWEAAKTLGQIGDARATKALINALEDEMFDVRWLAAEGLIAIGRPTLVPLLRKLTEEPDSLWLREGAHHVLHGINMGNQEEILLPVRNALEDIEAPLVVPFTVKVALTSLTKIPPSHLKKNQQIR